MDLNTMPEPTLAQNSEQKLRDIFADVLGLPPSEINDDVTYDQTKGWDSIAHMSLVAALESGFDIMLDTDEVIDMSSFAKARSILRKHGVAF
jgi:acyl carrier protein